VLDDGEVHPRGLREVRHEFEADVAKAHHDAGVRERRGVEDVRAPHPVHLVDAREVRDVQRRPRREHDVVGFEPVAADVEHAVVDELRGLVAERDVLALFHLLDSRAAVLREPEHVVVFRLHDRLQVDLRNTRQPVVRRA